MLQVTSSLPLFAHYIPIVGMITENRALEDVHQKIKRFIDENKCLIEFAFSNNKTEITVLIKSKQRLHEAGQMRNFITILIPMMSLGLVASSVSLIVILCFTILYFTKLLIDESRNVRKCKEAIVKQNNTFSTFCFSSDFLESLGIKEDACPQN